MHMLMSVCVQNIVDMMVNVFVDLAPCYNLPSMILKDSFFRTATHKA